jgi:hypothetical protein
MNLTAPEKSAVANGEAVRVSEDGLECVVLRADVYDRLKHLLYDDRQWTDKDLRRILAKSAEGNGWNEPAMDDYDQYDERLAKRCQSVAET